MGLQKVALNFMVERGGKLAKSLLCTKPQKAVANIKGLKYQNLQCDVTDFSSSKKILFKIGEQAGEGEKQLVAMNESGIELGNIVFSKCNGGIKATDLPLNYLDSNGNLLSYLYIESLYSKGIERGIGTALMKEALKESIKQGCEGRIILRAGAMGKGITHSPIPFYFKMGLHCCNQHNDVVFRKLPTSVLDNLQTTSLHYGGIGAQKMYLPLENVEYLLNK